MLQWMGGSRRNVAASRKSTQKRQKQYFQQKKRQHQQTAGYDNNTDVVNTCGEYHEKPKSLDILSFLNIATAAQECKSSLTNELDKHEETHASPERCHFLNSSPPTPRLTARTILKHIAEQKEATSSNSADCEVEHVNPQKVVSSSPVNKPSSQNHYSFKNGDTLENHQTETDQQPSVLDLLGDDAPNENSSGRPVRESHVAFSVEGLGNMGMGTPIHSPQQPGRFSRSDSTRKCQSFKNHRYMNDLGLELNSMIHDIDMPICDNPMKLPPNPRRFRVYSNLSEIERMDLKGGMPRDGHLPKNFNFCSDEERPYTNLENDERTSAPNFLEENFSMKRMHDSTWKNQAYYMDGLCADLSRDGKDNMPDFSFEDSYLTNKRDVTEELRDFSILGTPPRTESPASYFPHIAFGKDPGFLNLESKRYPAINERWNFSPSAWCSFPSEDGMDMDNMSLLSEESTSSVRRGKAKYSARSSRPGKSRIEYDSELYTNNANEYCNQDMYAEETVFQGMDRRYRGEKLNAPGRHTRVKDPLRTKLTDLHRFNKDFDSQYDRLAEGGFTSVDIDSCQLDQLKSPFYRASTSSESLQCKYWSEDLFGAFTNSSFCLNKHSSKKSKIDDLVDYAVSGSSLFTKTAPIPESFHYCDSPSFLKMESNSMKPDITQASRMQFDSPPSCDDTTGDRGGMGCPDEEEILECGDGESEIQPNACGCSPKEIEEEFSVKKTDSASENGKTVDAPTCNANSESMEAENETPDCSDQPVTEVCPEHVDATPAIIKLPKELERCKDDIIYQLDSGRRLPYQFSNKGNVDKEESGSQVNSESTEAHNKNPSYQVMLESYVLQLLCVQKVLTEASEQDFVKKS